MWVGCIQLHPEHRQKPLLLRSQISQFQGGRNSSKIHKSEVSNSCFQTSFSQRGGLFKNLLSKHLNQNEHISKSPVLTSLTSSCLWSSDVPWESWLVFLDRHASIGQAKGTVNLPRKQARLSKLLLLRRQSVLCLHFPLMLQHYSWKYGQPFSSVPSDPSRLLSSWIACASFIVLPRSPVLDTICMLTLPWKRGSFFLFSFFPPLRQSGRWKSMNGRPCPPRSSQQPSLFKVVMNQLCHILEKENSHYFDRMQ